MDKSIKLIYLFLVIESMGIRVEYRFSTNTYLRDGQGVFMD